MRSLILSFFFVMLAASPCVAKKSLTVGYLEFPPYYYTNDQGRPDGFLLNITKRVFHKAGVMVRFRSMPPAVIMNRIAEDPAFCSIGWFKTSERLKFARYSRPIYANRPLQLMFLKSAPNDFKGKSFNEILGDPAYRFGRLEGYSLGETTDRIVLRYGRNIITTSGTQKDLLKLLHDGHCSYILIAPEMTKSLISSSGYVADDFGLLDVPELGKGNLRYIMFNQSVDPGLLGRVNESIRNTVGLIL